MKQFQFAALAGLCLLAASAGDAAAWGRKGHGVVAQIAQDHLTPHAADRVAALCGSMAPKTWPPWPVGRPAEVKAAGTAHAYRPHDDG